MKQLIRTLTILALAAPCLQSASAAPVQAQELYALTRQNRIVRIDGYDSGQPATLTQITTWSSQQACAGSFDCDPTGLAVDEVTGDFFVLIGRWHGGGDSARLLSVKRATGDTTVVATLPHGLVNGLERRWDGKLVTIAELDRIVVIDPVTGSYTERPLSAPLDGVRLTFGPFNLDARGDLQVLASTNWAIDSSTGQVSPLSSIPDADQFIFQGDTPWVGGLATSNTGDVYLGTIFPGSVFRYDTVSAEWTIVYDDTITYENSNLYDLAITNTSFGADFDVVCEGAINSTGERATLEFSGVSTVATQDLTLVVRGLPSATIGMHLMGNSSSTTSVGSGTLCISPTVYRYGASASAVSETYAFEVDLSNLPNGQPALVGDLQIFQFWFRDNTLGVPTSNLSDALSVTFQ